MGEQSSMTEAKRLRQQIAELEQRVKALESRNLVPSALSEDSAESSRSEHDGTVELYPK